MKFTYASGSRPLEGFTIKRGIGAGGFGEVYFATSDAGKEVALKRVQRNLDIELRGVRQCLNLKHSNLVALFDIKYDDEGEAWVVMEYVSGETLKDLLERHPTGLSTEQVDYWFRSMASGVSYLHDHGIVHRDLKPGNIFDDISTVKIGDYGLSKFISCSRRSGQTESVGTFHYMAPEIGKGVYGKEIDIYALGIILYELVTGKVPFDGESSQEIMMKHLTEEPDLSIVPDKYARVVRRALTKDPEHRFSNVEEMLACYDGQSTPTPDPIVTSKQSVANEVLEITDDPVITAEPISSKRDEPVYIGDEADEMSFGPVQELAQPNTIADAEVVPSAHRTRGRATLQNVSAQRSGGWSRWMEGVEQNSVGSAFKIVMLVLLGFVAILNIHIALPLVALLAAIYVVFLGVRTLVMAPRKREALTQPVFEARIRKQLVNRPMADKAAELTGGWLSSALIVGALGVLSMTVVEHGLNGIQDWSAYTWVVLMSVGGGWGLLAVGQRWQATSATDWRRGTQLLIGMAMGGAAFAASGFFHTNLENQFVSLPRLGLALDAWYESGRPLLPAYLAYFGGLMVVVRWWKMVDPLRRHRFSLFASALCGLAAWVTSMVFYFPQPWGIMIAVTMAIAVQLSAPWVSWEEREKMRLELTEV